MIKIGSRLGIGLAFLSVILTTACEPEKPTDTSAPKSNSNIPADNADAGRPPSPQLGLRKIAWAKLPGWGRDNFNHLLPSWEISCGYWQMLAASGKVSLQSESELSIRPQELARSCEALPKTSQAHPTSKDIGAYFERYFTPYLIVNRHDPQSKGLFTGYYEATLQIDNQRHGAYQYPIYGRPADMITLNLGDFDPSLANRKINVRIDNRSILPFYNRNAIEAGSLSDKPLYYARDILDLYILHIQGSGRAIFPNGEVIRLGYDADNGLTYRSIGKILIEKGELQPDQASWEGIRHWLGQHPQQARQLLAENPRYIFFKASPLPSSLAASSPIPSPREANPKQGAKPSPKNTTLDGPLGALGLPLTPERSMAIDGRYFPLGLPIWLDIQTKEGKGGAGKLQRLVIGQDRGNAIKGVVRGDYFFGYGPAAARQAGAMRSEGAYYLLLPQDIQLPEALTLP